MKTFAATSLGVALLGLVTFGPTSPGARAQGLEALPKAVADEVQRAEAACRRTRGKPSYELKQLVRAVDISGDKLNDYLVDYSKFTCMGTGGRFLCSARGCQLQIFLSAGADKWVLAYDERVLNMAVVEKPDGAFVQFDTTGDGCAAGSTCQRRIVGKGTEIKFLD